MARTKITSTQLPRGTRKNLETSKLSKHLDSVNDLLADEHFGKYLIVKNSSTEKTKHNRQYMCLDAILEFMSLDSKNLGPLQGQKKRGISDIHLLSRFPQHYNFIQNTVFTLIKPYTHRATAGSLMKGFGHFLEVLKYIDWVTLEIISGSHLKAIEKDAKANDYEKTKLTDCTTFLRAVISHYSKDLKVPNYSKYAKKKKSSNNISLAVSWQCDVYACKELDETMKVVNEYKEWMKELKKMQEQFSQEELNKHGGLFSLNNLIFTYFDNIDNIGKQSGSTNRVIMRAAKSLYGINLQVWKYTRGRTIEDRRKEIALRAKSKGGINITINDERMFAIWYKIAVPSYPFQKDFLPQYSFIQKSIKDWKHKASKKCKFTVEVFNRRIYPDLQVVYPMYLLSVCRSGLNQQPIKDWHVWKDGQGNYHLGEDSGMGRIVDGYKGRGNSIQSTALDKQQCKYADFWCEYAKPMLEYSKDDHFFQHVENNTSNEDIVEVSRIDSTSFKSMFNGKAHFFYRNNIQDTIYLNDGQSKERRLYTIKHEKIRKIKNLSEYLEGKVQWERQYGLGHKDPNTEIIYQQTVEFKGLQQHRISTTMNELVDFFKGNLTAEDKPKLKILSGPLSNCKNPFEPTYMGAKDLRDEHVCINWSKCLTKCDKSQPVKNIHGPNIMAWQIVMEELRTMYSNDEWDRLFLIDSMAATAALSSFDFINDEKILCENKAKQPGRIAFIRREVLNSKSSRKLSLEEIYND